jgi:hypothetical protein
MSNQTVISTLTLTRPNVDVLFRQEIPEMNPDKIALYTYKNYIQTGKILSRSQSLSPDGLQLTLTTVWKSNDERFDYMCDPLIAKLFNIHKEHWIKNKIKCEYLNEEMDGDEFIRESRGFFNNPQ